MWKNDTENAPIFNVLTLKTETSAGCGKSFENMVSKGVLLSDFEHYIASKRLYIHINFFTLSKSGPFFLRGATHVPQILPQPTALNPCCRCCLVHFTELKLSLQH